MSSNIFKALRESRVIKEEEEKVQVTCPECGSTEVIILNEAQGIYTCRSCNYTFVNKCDEQCRVKEETEAVVNTTEDGVTVETPSAEVTATEDGVTVETPSASVTVTDGNECESPEDSEEPKGDVINYCAKCNVTFSGDPVCPVCGSTEVIKTKLLNPYVNVVESCDVIMKKIDALSSKLSGLIKEEDECESKVDYEAILKDLNAPEDIIKAATEGQIDVVKEYIKSKLGFLD